MTTFDAGGLTISPSFVREIRDVDDGKILHTSSNAYIITGEDGNQYVVSGRSGGTLRLILTRVDTGVDVWSLTPAQANTDSTAIGVNPPGGWRNASLELGFAGAIPETPYFIAFVSAAAGTSVDRGFILYKVNGAGAVVAVGGYAGQEGGTNVQFSPSLGAMTCLGFLPTNGFLGSNNTIPYRYPSVFGYTGESRSTIIVLPSINQILAQTPMTETLPKSPGSWYSKETRLSDAGLGANAWLTEDLYKGVEQRARAFVVPTADASALACTMWFTEDLEQYAAGTPAVANAFLTTNAPTYVTGLVTAVEVETTADSTIFGFTPSLTSTTTSVNNTIQTLAGGSAFPFSDDKKTFAGAGSTALLCYYNNPSVFPSDEDDPAEPWFVFWPRVDRTVRDEIGVRVFAWYPATQIMQELDYGVGQVFTLGVDVNSLTDPHAVSVTWDRTTKEVLLLMKNEDASASSLIVSSLGTFDPVLVVESTGGAPEEFRLRGWAFEQDGHEFYVLRLGQTGTVVYDRTTGQWSQWKTGSDVNWNAAVGRNWNNYVVAGALEDPYVWSVSPDTSLDNADVVGGDIPITRTVTGLVSQRGRERVRCGAVRITASVGATDVTNATMSLRFSDDYGNTFSPYFEITMSATDKYQDLSFRSLGTIRAPGRLFEVVDVGGATRIDDAVIEQ